MLMRSTIWITILSMSFLICVQTGAEAPAGGIQANSKPQPPAGLMEGKDDSWFVSIELSIPMTGSIGVTWGRMLNARTTIANFLYFFDRDWMVLLEKGDWHSNSFYTGLSFYYFPFAKKNQYEGYFIGGDFGLAVSRQEFKPLKKSDIFFYPFVDAYLMGYVIPIRGGLKMDCLLGGGWAPVESQVVIDGNRNPGDYYPLVNARLSYWW